jgi:hypothetical protein
MRILKEYEIKLNISATTMYSGLLTEQYLLNHIKDRFEGKCLDGSFLTNVRTISERSMVQMDKNDLAGGGSLCVVVRAEAIVYPPESIIVGAEVTTIERDGRIICKYDNAIIHLKGDKRFSPNKGDLIPVRVIRTGYPPGSTNMNIAAQPFFIRPSFYMKLFKPDPLSNEEQDLIKRKMTEISDVKTAYDACDKKLVQFFEDLFYPFKDDYSKGKAKCPFDTKDIIALTTKQDLPKQKPLLLSRHSMIHKSSTDAIILDVDTVKKLPVSPWADKNVLDIQIAPASFGATMLELLDDYCSFLSCIVQCCEVYNTEIIRKKHQKIWTIYQQIKV